LSIKIIIADDHAIMLQGLRSLLEGQPGFEVIGQASDGRSAVDMAHRLKPDIIVLDVSMPILNGVEAARRILAENPSVKVLALSMHSQKRFVTEMLKAGASGYLLKDSDIDELVHAVKTVLSGKIYLSPSIAGVVVEEIVHGRSRGEGSISEKLTPREREVLQLVVEGKTSKEIASLLNLSVRTVDTHRNQIMRKLGCNNVVELTRIAIREGLTQP